MAEEKKEKQQDNSSTQTQAEDSGSVGQPGAGLMSANLTSPEAVLMIVSAGLFDSLGLIPVINIFSTIFGWGFFGLWAFTKQGGRKMLFSFLGAGLLGLIPVVSDFTWVITLASIGKIPATWTGFVLKALKTSPQKQSSPSGVMGGIKNKSEEENNQLQNTTSQKPSSASEAMGEILGTNKSKITNSQLRQTPITNNLSQQANQSAQSGISGVASSPEKQQATSSEGNNNMLNKGAITSKMSTAVGAISTVGQNATKSLQSNIKNKIAEGIQKQSRGKNLGGDNFNYAAALKDPSKKIARQKKSAEMRLTKQKQKEEIERETEFLQEKAEVDYRAKKLSTPETIKLDDYILGPDAEDKQTPEYLGINPDSKEKSKQRRQNELKRATGQEFNKTGVLEFNEETGERILPEEKTTQITDDELRPMTDEEIKEERRNAIIKNIEKEWEKENGPMFRQLTKQEIEDRKFIASKEKREWDGDTKTLTDKANEFFFDHKGQGKNSVPAMADKILAKEFPEETSKKTAERSHERNIKETEDRVNKQKIEASIPFARRAPIKENSKDLFLKAVENEVKALEVSGRITTEQAKEKIASASLIEEGFSDDLENDARIFALAGIAEDIKPDKNIVSTNTTQIPPAKGTNIIEEINSSNEPNQEDAKETHTSKKRQTIKLKDNPNIKNAVLLRSIIINGNITTVEAAINKIKDLIKLPANKTNDRAITKILMTLMGLSSTIGYENLLVELMKESEKSLNTLSIKYFNRTELNRIEKLFKNINQTKKAA